MVNWTSRLLTVVVALGPVLASGTGIAPSQPAPAMGVVGDGTPASCTEANFSLAFASGSPVTFNCGGPKTIPLVAEFLFNDSRIIDGGHVITLEASGSGPMFAPGTAADLTLSNLTLAGAPAVAADGGIIVNHGRLTIADSTLQNAGVTSAHSGGAIFSTGRLTVTHSIFKGNSAGNGGAIFLNSNQAQAFIRDSTFSQNHAVNLALGYGGAIWVGPQARLTLIGGALFGNTAKFGGGVYVSPLALATLGSDATVVQLTSNLASTGGGGLYNDEGTLDISWALISSNRTLTTTSSYGGAIATTGALTLTGSYLAENLSRSGGGVFAGGQPNPFSVVIDHTQLVANTADNGGGLFTNATSVLMTVTDSNFYANLAHGLGGGLLRANAHLEITRSSFWLNRADQGGGLYLTALPLTNTGVAGYVNLRDSTIATNTAQTGVGGGLYNNDRLALFNVTVKDNTTGLYNDTGGDTRLRGTVLQNPGGNCAGVVIPSDQSFNFATDTTCNFSFSQQGNALNPLLGLLTPDPNGVTWYYVPLVGSPLIDHGPSDCSTLDQRRAQRLGACDIGAVEFGGLLPVLWLPLVTR